MAARLWVTSLTRTGVTAAQVTGQNRGVSPREVAGGRARGQQLALELLARGRLPGSLQKPRPEQPTFLDQPNEMGGTGLVVHGVTGLERQPGPSL